MSGDQQKIANALYLAHQYSQIDGAHHKTWVIDQMVRALIGNPPEPDFNFDVPTTYAQFIKRYRHGEDGPETYNWDEGIAP